MDKQRRHRLAEAEDIVEAPVVGQAKARHERIEDFRIGLERLPRSERRGGAVTAATSRAGCVGGLTSQEPIGDARRSQSP